MHPFQLKLFINTFILKLNIIIIMIQFIYYIGIGATSWNCYVLISVSSCRHQIRTLGSADTKLLKIKQETHGIKYLH